MQPDGASFTSPTARWCINHFPYRQRVHHFTCCTMYTHPTYRQMVHLPHLLSDGAFTSPTARWCIYLTYRQMVHLSLLPPDGPFTSPSAIWCIYLICRQMVHLLPLPPDGVWPSLSAGNISHIFLIRASVTLRRRSVETLQDK